MLRNMEGSVLGIWVAHGEGQIKDIDNTSINQYPIRYVNSDGNITNQYPDNPNGTQLGIASMCSLDGSHLLITASKN